MAHQRKLIRDAVVARLVAANTTAGARVKPTRVEPLRPAELPTISVYTLSEDVDRDSAMTAPRELERELQLEIACHVEHTLALPVDDAMDAMAEQIEAAMDANRYITGTVGESIMLGTEMSIVEPLSDPLIGIVTLTYLVTYRTSPALAELDDFESVDSKQKIAGGVVDTVPAEDTFVVQGAP